MAVGRTKEWRMEAARLALAYMAGGDPPYQAARKTGFMRVSVMEEAIKELEKEQGKQDQIETAEQQVHGLDAPQPETSKSETMPVMCAEFTNSAFCVREYEPKDGKDGMVRIWAGNRPQYIYASIQRVPMLIDLLKEAATGKGSKPGMDERDLLIREKDAQILKLQRDLAEAMEQLRQERQNSGAAEMQERMGQLTVELDMERQLNQKLKDKILELILET